MIDLSLRTYRHLRWITFQWHKVHQPTIPPFQDCLGCQAVLRNVALGVKKELGHAPGSGLIDLSVKYCIVLCTLRTQTLLYFLGIKYQLTLFGTFWCPYYLMARKAHMKSDGLHAVRKPIG